LKKNLLKVFMLPVFIILFCLAVYAPSADNFSNITNDFENKTYSLDETTLVNWAETNGTYISTEDPQIIVSDVDCFVHTVKLSGLINPICEEIQIFYTNSDDENFSEGKCIWRSYTVSGNNIIITLDVMASSLRFDVSQDPGVELQLQSVEINDRSPVFSINAIAKFCVVPTLAIGAILYLILNHKALAPYFFTFQKFIPLLKNLISRDLKVKYRRSVLGFMWSILNPLLMALVLNIVFAKLFRFQIEYFATYYLIGALIFNFVIECTTGSMMSVIGAAPLIKKVYIPKYIFPLQKCAFAFINMLFGSVAVVVVMLIQGVPFHWTMLMFFVPMLYAFVFAYGFGLILAAFTVFFRDIEHLYSVWCTIWMYLTPIIYPEELLISNGLSVVMKLNPMYYFVHILRNIVMYNTLPTMSDHIMCLSFSMIFLFLGLGIFKKAQDKFILYI
jgi:ABC-2 type transport system permease protein